MLNQEEKNRYKRQITIPSFGVLGQEKLKLASVLVIGCGGLGHPVLQYLVSAGIGRIGIVEDDRVEISNLQRQVIYKESDVSKSKLSVTIEALSALNSHVIFDAYPIRLSANNAIEIARGFDLLVDCSDNFSTRYLVNDVCEILNKPFVYGALHRFEGQVAVFNYKNSVCYRDLFENPPNAALAPNCETAGVIGAIAGIVGTIMASEAIKVLSEVGEPLINKLLSIDAETLTFRKLKIAKNTSRDKITKLIDYDEFCGVSNVKEIDYFSFVAQKEDFVQVIDVREPWEFKIQNLNGVNIPLGEILERKEEINKKGKVLVHCQAGGRSKSAIDLLQNEGFENLINLKGGINAANLESPEE